MRHLGTGAEAWFAAGPRDIVGVPLEGGALAWYPLGNDEFERPRTDRFLDLLSRVGLGEPLRHYRAVGLGQGFRQKRKRLLETEPDRLVGDCRELVGAVHQRLTHRVLLGPPGYRGDAVRCPDRGAVVEHQPVPQLQIPSQAVILYRMAFDHLRLSVEFCIVAVKRVVHRQSEVAGNIGGGPNRVEGGEVGVRHEGNGLLHLRAPDLWDSECHRTGERRFHQTSSSDSQGSQPFPPGSY